MIYDSFLEFNTLAVDLFILKHMLWLISLVNMCWRSSNTCNYLLISIQMTLFHEFSQIFNFFLCKKTSISFNVMGSFNFIFVNQQHPIMHQLHESGFCNLQAKRNLWHDVKMCEFNIKLSRGPSHILKYLIVPFFPKKP